MIADLILRILRWMTAHSLSRIDALVEVPKRIADECRRVNRRLEMIRRARIGWHSPQKIPVESKKANPEIGLSA